MDPEAAVVGVMIASSDAVEPGVWTEEATGCFFSAAIFVLAGAPAVAAAGSVEVSILVFPVAIINCKVVTAFGTKN